MVNALAVQGQFQRIIRLETAVEHAYSYFTDFNHVLPRLPEVDRVLRYRDGRYRMVFSADDGRGHEMSIVFDIRHELTPHHSVKIVPVPLTIEQIRGDKSMGSGPLMPGTFSGETTFHRKGDCTEVVYQVDLHIDVEVPKFLGFMPMGVLQKLGDALMSMKLRQVADGVTQKTPSDFARWFTKRQEELEVEQREKITVITRAGEAITNLKSANLKADPLPN